MGSDFTREIIFHPAFDRRHPDPAKNYGVHGVELCFFLKGPKATIQFVVYTNWQLPHVTKEEGYDRHHLLCRPTPADLGYHSPVPMYEGQRPSGSVRFEWREPTEDEKAHGFLTKVPQTIETENYTPCDLVEGGLCFYDGSSLAANDVFEILLTEGSEGVWKELEKNYHERFEHGDS